MATCTLTRFGRLLVATAFLGALLFVGAVAQAEFIGLGPNGNMAFRVTVSDGIDTVSQDLLDIPPDLPGNADENAGEHRFAHFVGNLPPGLEFRSGNKVLATLDAIGIELDGDPLVNLNFTATAGSSNVTFTISSAAVSFPPGLANPAAHARADLTLNDNLPDGASIVPVAPNSGLFRASYNGGSLYGERLGAISFSGGGGSVGPVVDDPGWNSIAGTVSSIQAQWKFTLSARDTASGNGSFEVSQVLVPEPSTAVLCGVAVVALLAGAWWRRGRR